MDFTDLFFDLEGDLSSFGSWNLIGTGKVKEETRGVNLTCVRACVCSFHLNG